MNDQRPDDKFDALLRHSLRSAPASEPPPDFAREMAALAADQPEAAAVETWAVRALCGLAAVAVCLVAMPFVNPLLSRTYHVLAGAPWPLLVVAGGVFGALKLMDLVHAPEAPRLR